MATKKLSFRTNCESKSGVEKSTAKNFSRKLYRRKMETINLNKSDSVTLPRLSLMSIFFPRNSQRKEYRFFCYEGSCHVIGRQFLAKFIRWNSGPWLTDIIIKGSSGEKCICHDVSGQTTVASMEAIKVSERDGETNVLRFCCMACITLYCISAQYGS